MRRTIFGLVSVATLAILGTAAQAQPLVATYTGLVLGTKDAFTAAFHYDTTDLTVSPGNSDYLDAKSDTVQWATYSDPFRSFTFGSPGSFSKGEYDSVVYDENGDGGIAEINTVHEYSIFASDGSLSLTFGGANDMGLLVFSPDGLDYANLDPTSFLLTKDVISPVPLPSTAPLLAAALVLLGLVGHARIGRSLTSAR